MIDNDAVERPSRLSLVLTALSIGIALGAALVSLYAFTRRVPDGLVSDRLGTATHFLGGSLVAVAVGAVAVAGGGVAVLSGRAVTGRAATLLCLLTTVTAWSYLGSGLQNSTEAVSGPGGQPIVTLTQSSWILLTISAVFLIAGAITLRQKHQSSKWQAALPFVVAGVTAATVTSFGLVALGRIGTARPTTSSSIATPEFPRTLGNHTAYTLTADNIDTLTPAGPGFVLAGRDAVVAYDGATGIERWQFPFSAFPRGCVFHRLRSTGTAPDAVVLAECVRVPTFNELRDSFLVGIDAMTGQVLWSLDQDWSLQGRAQLPADAVPVVSHGELGSLDAREGTLRWTRSLTELRRQCRDVDGLTMAAEHAIVYAVPCEKSLKVTILDASTGAERVIERTVSHPLEKSGSPVDPVASYGSVVAMHARYETINPSLDLVIDTDTGAVSETPEYRVVTDLDSTGVGQYPGDTVQFTFTAPIGESLDLYRITQGTTVHVNGLEVLDVGSAYGLLSSQLWTEVGDQLVTAAVYNRDSSRQLALVSSDGTYTRRPSPCGDALGSIVSVPGAVLIACQRSPGVNDEHYDILGVPPS